MKIQTGNQNELVTRLLLATASLVMSIGTRQTVQPAAAGRPGTPRR